MVRRCAPSRRPVLGCLGMRLSRTVACGVDLGAVTRSGLSPDHRHAGIVVAVAGDRDSLGEGVQVSDLVRGQRE